MGEAPQTLSPGPSDHSSLSPISVIPIGQLNTGKTSGPQSHTAGSCSGHPACSTSLLPSPSYIPQPLSIQASHCDHCGPLPPMPPETLPEPVSVHRTELPRTEGEERPFLSPAPVPRTKVRDDGEGQGVGLSCAVASLH